MSAEVESMMYTREKPWHGLGTMAQDAPDSAAAIKLAGLDWTVSGLPVYDAQSAAAQDGKLPREQLLPHHGRASARGYGR